MGMLPRFTPRQRVALSFPCKDEVDREHPRFTRRTGGWTSMLTFEVESGLWRAAAKTHPETPIAEWSKLHMDEVKMVLGRLIARVGVGAPRVGLDGFFVVFTVDATEAEKMLAKRGELH